MDLSRFLDKASSGRLTGEEAQQCAIELAGLMLNEAKRIQTHSERIHQRQLARLVNDPIGKTFVTLMTDQCFRSRNSARAADQLLYLLDKYGMPDFLSTGQRIEFAIFKRFGRPLSKLLMPLVKGMLRRATSTVIMPGEPKKLSQHILKRREEGVQLNLNHLGEAILGEEEAARRLKIYLNDLTDPNIDYISVKVSTLFSQINLVGWENTLTVLSDRLKQLYRAAIQHGKDKPKFVNLDMEEYRDLHLTVELFQHLLEQKEFYSLPAGIVLQSYLPDAFQIQQQLTEWAMKRVKRGGAPIKVRLVKGANMSMEKVEASLRDWELATYSNKWETDANYKRMILYGCQPEHIKAVHLGIASHNLFDIAHALVLRKEHGLEKSMSFEMLEGMAGSMQRVVQALSGDMLLYCPVATAEEFQYTIAYLMRRLDENTTEENFLRHSFDLSLGSPEWQNQVDLFLLSCRQSSSISSTPKRHQNRLVPPLEIPFDAPFSNEPDTDWSLPQNRKWADELVKTWSSKQYETIPLVIGNQEIASGVPFNQGVDPSCPHQKLYDYAIAGEKELEMALQTALIGFKKWNEIPLQQRMHVLDNVAQKLRSQRADLIGAMIADTGKTVAEADIEVSEAIDFAAYYRRSSEAFHAMDEIQWSGKGPILVAPPWNFPCSIAASGILAALSAGNSVIFKPAPEAVLVGWTLINIFWEAGISREALQFFCCNDDPIGSRLIQEARMACVILTGATGTAKRFLKMRAGLNLMAETGGKNALIITSMADRDLAIRDLIQSAFGHAGQKCSACSLAILEREVYDDPHFRMQLRDATASLPVGAAWDLSTKIPPLIGPPSKQLLRGLTSLEEGEEWLLKPIQDQQNPHLWSPGIKMGVQQGSFTHQTELFGPVLGVMCAENVEEAIEFANSTPYGLTSGIHTLDEREQNQWKKQIIAGNCYINRGITGAIVQRQPFGGCKNSGFGPGMKAGGPNYIQQFMEPQQKQLPKGKEPLSQAVLTLSPKVLQWNWDQETIDLWNSSIENYAFAWNHDYAKPRDYSLVLGESNMLYYVPRLNLILRVQANDRPIDFLRAVAAALTCSAPIVLSIPQDYEILLEEKLLEGLGLLTILRETEAKFSKRLSSNRIERLRMLSRPSKPLLDAIGEAGCSLEVAPVLASGRLELLHYLREVSVSHVYHRYGYGVVS